MLQARNSIDIENHISNSHWYHCNNIVCTLRSVESFICCLAILNKQYALFLHCIINPSLQEMGIHSSFGPYKYNDGGSWRYYSRGGWSTHIQFPLYQQDKGTPIASVLRKPNTALFAFSLQLMQSLN